MFGLPCCISGNESACQAGDAGSIPGLGRSHVEGNGNPLQYSCLKNSMERGARWATVHGVTKSQTQLKWPSSSKGLEKGAEELENQLCFIVLHGICLLLQSPACSKALIGDFYLCSCHLYRFPENLLFKILLWNECPIVKRKQCMPLGWQTFSQWLTTWSFTTMCVVNSTC